MRHRRYGVIIYGAVILLVFLSFDLKCVLLFVDWV